MLARSLLSTSLKMLTMNSIRAAPAMTVLPRACFSTNFAAVEKGINKLNKALEKEIAYENENYSKLEDIDTYLNESGFEFEEEDNGINLVLKKDLGDKTLEVKFESRAPMPEDDVPMPEEMQHSDGEDDYAGDNFCDFSVFISNKNNKEGLVVECTSMDTEISFSNMLMCEDVDKVKSLGRFERHMNLYPGPEFQTLDERIQTGMVEYLEGMGINEHLAAFVECMSLDKDQRLYMKWLGNLKNFINE